jgi:HopA1 effector protein family
MPTIDYTQTSLNAHQSELALISILEDIANNVEMRDDFSICHPLYQPLEIPQEAVARFQQMPAQIQQKFLSLQVRSFLYGIYYNGSMRSSLALDAEPQTLQLDLENNSVKGIDTAFFQRLHEANSGEGFFDRGWQVLTAENDDIVVVKKGELRLYVQREQYLTEAERQAQIGDTVAIKMPKNRMQNGFYMSVGNKGFCHSQPGDTLVRIYFNLTPDGSVAVMESLTKGLNEIGIPFTFKVLYNPQDYNRYDAGVLYFDRQDYPTVMQVIRSFHDRYQSHFKPEIPLFTKQIAIGIGLAEEPSLKFAERESFGMNRCQIIANGLLSLDRTNSSRTDRLNAILEQFSTLGISLQQPYLNSDSLDIYDDVISNTAKSSNYYE